MQPPDAGFWGMPADMLAAVPGYARTYRRTARKPAPS